MRQLADRDRIRQFIRALGADADREATCYFTGGGTAVLLGWRDSTIDVDVKLVPETDALLRAIQHLKNELRINVELASPAEYAQALSKLERNHTQDRGDVEAMLERGLIEPAGALAYFAEIEPDLYRFPAIDPKSFRRRVEAALAP